MICNYIRWYVFLVSLMMIKHHFYIYVIRFCRNRKKNEDVDNMLIRVLHCNSILETMDITMDVTI